MVKNQMEKTTRNEVDTAFIQGEGGSRDGIASAQQRFLGGRVHSYSKVVPKPKTLNSVSGNNIGHRKLYTVRLLECTYWLLVGNKGL